MTDKINLQDRYKTACGYPVELQWDDMGGRFPRGGRYFRDEQWWPHKWSLDGVSYLGFADLHLVKAPYITADMIPWSHIHPDIKWVAGDCYDHRTFPRQRWYGHDDKPRIGGRAWYSDIDITPISLRGVAGMPDYDSERWRETLVKRPEGE
jgi:hypothetical protein